MNVDLILHNLLSPPILFFFLGILAVFIGSDLEIPQPLPKLFSLYLLLSIGYRGGAELAHSGFTSEVFISLGAAIVMAFLVPIYSFFILKRKLDVYNAAAVAATYGSVSAVTFITAASFLHDLNIAYSGHMVAAMALMESPAIVIGVVLVNVYAKTPEKKKSHTRHILKEAFTNGSVLILLGSLLIAVLCGEHGEEAMKPFTEDIFKGMLTFFLLDMGLLAARRLKALREAGVFIIGFALIFPVVNAFAGIGISYLLGFSQGNALLFTILCAGASYIAVPAAMRMAVPKANPGIYVPMSLAITFPFNITIGIPLYFYVIQHII
jgi:uncharacterized protein